MTAPTTSAADLVTLTIDGVEVRVPKGTLIIRAAEEIGIQIPRFCDHPLLDPAGACRQCLVEVAMPGRDGKIAPMPKPQAACTMTVAPGMEVKTQQTSPVAEKAQHGVMELLLINHPLDCPVCDKGGECPLQNQAMSNGRATTRFEDVKRTYAKPVNISSQVLLDRERCVLCQRCTRFSEQIAGDPFISLTERGAVSQIGIYQDKPFQSYFSGNTVQICPVGALTGAAYRFRSRPFDLMSTPSTCEHCASGCSLRTDHRRGVVLRRMAINNPEVNEEWNCDKGRWAFQYATQSDRLAYPMVRGADGELHVASWPEALEAAAAGLARARSAGVLTGGRVSTHDAYAYSKFARTVLGTSSIDFRARPHSVEEAEFLAAHVVLTAPGHGAVTYTDLEKAKAVLLVGLEPEDESPMVFLRLRKAFRKSRATIFTVAPYASRGTTKLGATVLQAAPGLEAEVLAAVRDGEDVFAEVGSTLREAGGDAVVLVGERLAATSGGYYAALDLASSLGAPLAWVPRRAGERGALETGCLPTLLPGGRPITAEGRASLGETWDLSRLTDEPGLDTSGMLREAAEGRLDALVIGGVDLGDLPDPGQARTACERAFVVSLELRESAITRLADVVLPVAAVAEKSGAFLDWEGRVGPFSAALETELMSDYRVLDLIAGEMGAYLGTRTSAQIEREMQQLGPWAGPRALVNPVAPVVPARSGAGLAVLATWHQLLDDGSLQDGEPYLAGTSVATVARMSQATADAASVSDGDLVTIHSDAGTVSYPVHVTAGMVDHVVWVPTNSAGQSVRTRLAADNGDIVTLTKGAAL
ncbi:NADH-quinone oxidoreductase subunit G [Arsenicicoccus dermatophilus]|uniref:NADH-quinone oxidoreductase subunit G n=1 Tax=Arsenicicoccus dermatophilus TaxID=1076331 RepID=UPI001F4C9988|nr:NADH-quinone oxidoreductase subunit G [Arsenicicoccus dermatophilus]MCH8613837.1 NADH-quinone oxidoreductase subunit G [Arsenicicoccus dermatophilus]